MSRRMATLLAAVLGLGFAGCGGGTKTVTVQASTSQTAATTLSDDPLCVNGKDSANGSPCTPLTSTTATTARTTNAGLPDCASINDRSFVGRCTHGGVLFTFANRGSTARLKTLSAKVVNVATADSVSNGSGFTANAHGTFVIVTIAVTNRTTSPQTFDEGTATSQGQAPPAEIRRRHHPRPRRAPRRLAAM